MILPTLSRDKKVHYRNIRMLLRFQKHLEGAKKEIAVKE